MQLVIQNNEQSPTFIMKIKYPIRVDAPGFQRIPVQCVGTNVTYVPISTKETITLSTKPNEMLYLSL